MKLDEHVVTVEGDLVYAEEIDMNVDPSPKASAIMLRSLIDQYSNPHAAVLRELTSNAWDSHKEAGQTRPVEVSLPSMLSPRFVVEDFGTGMTREEMGQFGQFIRSTKNDSNNSIGGWGLGSKSPLALSSEYTVASVKDGLRNVAVVGRRADGTPYMGFITAEGTPTDAPNGVKITVPISSTHEFQYAIDRGMFLGWEPGSILIDGVAPKRSIYDTESYTPVGDYGWEIAPPLVGGDFYALVGPVLYEIREENLTDVLDEEVIDKILPNYVLKFEIGSVTLPSNRENLIYSPKTIRAIKDRVAGITAEGRKLYEKRVADAFTLREAMTIALVTAPKAGFVGPYDYKGHTLTKPTKGALSVFNAADSDLISSVSAHGSTKSSMTTATLAMSYANLLRYGNTLLVTGSTQMYTRPASRRISMARLHWQVRYVAQYRTQTGEEPSIYFTSQTPEQLGDEFMALFGSTVTEADYKATVAARRREVRKNRQPRAVKTVKEMMVHVLVPMRNGESYTVDQKLSDLDLKDTYILLQNGTDNVTEMARAVLSTKRGANRYSDLAKTLPRALKSDRPKYKILFLYKNENLKALAKELPHQVSIATLIERQLRRDIKDVSIEALKARAMAQQTRASTSIYWVGPLTDSDVEGIINEDTREWVQLRRTYQNNVDVLDTPRTTLHALRLVSPMDSSKVKKYEDQLSILATTDTPQDNLYKYPLLNGYISAKGPDIVHYINLIDAELESATLEELLLESV